MSHGLFSFSVKQQKQKTDKYKHMTTPNISATKDLEVKRNDITLTFSPAGFKRGPKKDDEIKYPGLEIADKDSLIKFVDWMGEEDFFPFINARLAQLWQTVHNAATEDGKKEWSAEDNKTMLEKLSTRGETKAVIDAKVKALIADLNNPELLSAMAKMGTPEQMDALQKFGKISADLKKFSDILESKKRVRTGDEDDTEETTSAPVAAPVHA